METRGLHDLAPEQNPGKYRWTDRVVLITEDEEVNFYYLKTIFRKTEARVLRARHGKEAIEIISDYGGKIDLVLMDLNMPVMDGFEALRIIRSKYPSLPVIAQTAYALSEDRHKCMEAGFNDYISKPINRMTLFRLINETLS